MVRRRDLWGWGLIKKDSIKRILDDKEGCTTCYFFPPVTCFSFFPSLSSLFFCERTIHLSQMNINAVLNYQGEGGGGKKTQQQQQRWRLGEHEKRLSKPISVCGTLPLPWRTKYHVKKLSRSSPSLFSRRRTLVKIYLVIWMTKKILL